MFTPQQIDEIAFDKAVFGGYDMQSVDEFLEPLTEDYITLYKENALLKSKMRVLVEKLEEYRRNEASMRDAIVNAQKTCDKMVREAEAKCTTMLNNANAAAAENAKNAGTLIAAENERVEGGQEGRFRQDHRDPEPDEVLHSGAGADQECQPSRSRSQGAAFDYENPDGKSADADAVADEISNNLEALVGTTEDTAPVAPPRHPQSETTSKFTNLQFGRNYDVTQH